MRQLSKILNANDGDIARRLIEIVQAIVLVLDTQGRIVFFNRYLEELWGGSLDDVRGREWFSTFIPERDRERIKALYQRAVAGERIAGHVNPLVTRAGEERAIEWSGGILSDDRGDTIGVLSVGIDVTERQRLEQQLEDQERLATIGTTASVFAHEIGNPLNAMNLHVRLLAGHLQDVEIGGEANESLEIVRAELRRLSHLLRDFRSFGRRQQLELKATDLGRLVEEVVAAHAPVCDREQIEVHWKPPQEPAMVLASRDKLKQVIVNLVNNAIEAMPAGGELRIAVACSKHGLTLDVADTGVGISPDMDVFQPFETSKPHGTGLGLPIARQLVLAHGGELSYESELHRGTTFTVTLPHEAAQQQGDEPPPET